jgi:chemotaxis protein MotB
MALPNQREIFVIKKKIAPEAHGGSAWKVAYADFVTAMMAFFLLLWLLNATTEEQKQGISNYFEPVGATNNSTGSGGLVGGISATDPGPIRIPGQTPSQSVTYRRQEATPKEEDVSQGNPSDRVKTPRREELPRNTDEDRQFDAAKTVVHRAMEQVPELQDLHESISVDIVREGLRIRLMDSEKHPLFDRGGTNLNATGEKLMRVVADVVERMPNDLQISGHTTRNDETTYAGGTNWDISIRRAYSARRMLAKLGTPETRFDAVRGSASQVPIDHRNPTLPANRRIEVTLLRVPKKQDAQDLIPPSVMQPGETVSP